MDALTVCRTVVATSCVLGSIMLAWERRQGWGWLIFAAILVAP
jgi:multisubunit Na+/H+ antiporter MnhG subunit